MNMVRIAVCCLLLLVSVRLCDAQQEKPIEVPAAEAKAHALTKLEPVYPPLAKAAHVQGTVVVSAAITAKGTVSDVKAVSGHPMLTPSALEAVKGQKYQPFLANGGAVPVITTVEVSFGATNLAVGGEEASDRYFKAEEKCRELLQQRQYSNAEQACTPLVELVGELPKERRLERVTAYQYAGHSEFGQRKFADALGFYKQEVTIAEATLKPTDAELAYAYRDIARALHGTGDLQQAKTYYERAVKTLEAAHDHIESEFLKNKYSGTLKSVLRDYAALLRQSGDPTTADAVEQKANSIVVKTDVKD
jgi:TonB family protein